MKAGSFAAIAAVACLTLAGCEINVNQPWTQVELDQNSLTIPPPSGGRVYNVGIRGGSGDYREEISDWTIADVRIERTFGAGTMLCIDPKREGDAIVTVTDRKTGDRARLSLKVARYAVTLNVGDVRWAVDADSPAEIEAALKADTSVPPVGGAILTGTVWDDDPAEWAFTDADGRQFATGTFVQRQLKPEEWNPVFNSVMNDTRAVSLQRWTLSGSDGSQRRLDLAISHATRMAMPVYYRLSFYEDLTERYKSEFPDAGVRGVARAIVISGTTGQ